MVILWNQGRDSLFQKLLNLSRSDSSNGVVSSTKKFLIDKNSRDASSARNILQLVLDRAHVGIGLDFKSFEVDSGWFERRFGICAEWTKGFADHDDSMRLDRVFHKAWGRARMLL